MSEAEAECVVLRRENEELKAYRMGGEGIVEVLRRENAILRREGGAVKDELERMRGVLGNINGNIYGKKAAEMCREVALGGGGGWVRKPLGSLRENGKGKKSEEKTQRRKPFV